jgi:hypothetical protein
MVVYSQSVRLGVKTLETHDRYFFNWTLSVFFCRLQFLLELASASQFRSRGTLDHILLSYIRDSSTWRARSPYLFTQEQVGPVKPPGIGFPFVTSNYYQGYCEGILTTESEEPYVTTDDQSASLSWNKASIWGLRPHFYYYQTVASLLMWSDLSDKRTGLTFTIASDPRQRSHFPVRVPWDSWSYFMVSDSRLSFSSPPTTRRATVDVSDHASTWDRCFLCDLCQVYITKIPAVSWE